MSVKFKGFDQFNKELKKLEKKTKELKKGASVSFNELFNDRFMSKYTDFNNIDEFFDNSPFTVETNEDFDKIDEHELNEYVRNNSRFSDWADMQGTAGEEWTVKQLGF